MSVPEDLRDISKLVGNAVEQLGKLVQNEAELARAEVGQKLAAMASGGGLIAASAVLIIPALVMALFALATYLILSIGIFPPVAYLLAAGVGAAISAILFFAGLRYFDREQITPKVTLEQLSKDAAAVKEMAR